MLATNSSKKFEESPSQVVESLIESNKIVVFSKTWCPYCRKAKHFLTDKGLEFAVLELDNRTDGTAIQQYLAQKTGQTSVPNIWIDHKFIGGSSDLVELDRQGKL